MKPGTVFVISGAAKGIGAATAELVVRTGHRAVICDIDARAAGELAARLGDAAYPLRVDVRQPDDWAQALMLTSQHFGSVDVVVNNAGLIHIGFVREQTDEQIRHMVDVNFVGLVTACRSVLPFLLEQGHGHIVNVGSLAGFVPLKGQAVYSATKHAVRAFHHALALENESEPIEFSLVCPAAVDTGMLRQQLGHDAAALSFADQALKAGEVAQAIVHAVEQRRQEVLVPALRGALIRQLGIYPTAVRAVTHVTESRGRREMQRRAESQAPGSDNRYHRG